MDTTIVIKKYLGLELEEIDPDVNFYSPFMLVFEDENADQVSIALEYEQLAKLRDELSRIIKKEEIRDDGNSTRNN